MPIIRRPQLYHAPSGISLPIGCHATHWLKVNIKKQQMQIYKYVQSDIVIFVNMYLSLL
jgi:hypothetical protein